MRQQLLQQLRCLPFPRQEAGETVPVESEALGALFPSGVRRGSLTEWVNAGRGCGVESLTLKLVAHLGRGVLVVIDSQHDFYPPAASALGIPLADMFIVRPKREADALWAIEQSLRCRGVSFVLSRLNQIEGRQFRRLQLAAEHGRTIGILLRPAQARASPSWSQSRFLVRALPSQPAGRRLQVESLPLDGRDVVELEMNDETGDLRLVSRVADSTVVRRAARA